MGAGPAGPGRRGHGTGPSGVRRRVGHRGSAVASHTFSPCWRTSLPTWASTEVGLQVLAEAHTLVEQQEERWWEAEIHRLRGVLLLRQTETSQAEAETWLQRALDVARRQEAKALELRAAMSLARLWHEQGKSAEAHSLLAPLYGWFTEGHETADLQAARAMLERLS